MLRPAWIAALAGLAGCAAAPPPPSAALSGRLALQIAAHGEQAARSMAAAFTLSGDAERGELDLSSPLGTTLARASWAPGEARLATPDGEQRFADLEQLSQQAFGEPLPLRALPDWLRGRPWPGAAAAPLEPGPGFVQLNWSIDLAAFGAGDLQAARHGPPEVRLRVRLDRRP